jgi:RNA polymerase sigma factor (sigma-70 family)
VSAVTIEQEGERAPRVPDVRSAAEAHLDDVYRYLLYMTRNPTTAEDLTSETFARACASWPKFDPRRGSARTWLCQLARTAALDWLRAEERRVRREQAVAAETPAAAEAAFVEGLTPELESALAQLSAGEREVVALRVVLELDTDTAARVLGISPSNCTTRLSRALTKLERTLEADVAA